MAALAFILKKTVASLLFPVGLVCLLGLMALLLAGRGRRPAVWGRRLGWLAWLLLLSLSLPLVGHSLLARLEAAAGPRAEPAALAAAGVRTIVVLGGGVQQGDITDFNRLGGPSLQRLLEGVRLWRGLPGAKLVVSGGSLLEGVAVGPAMGRAAQDLGVPPEALAVEHGSWDTMDEARLLAQDLAGQPFALVTSASHMRRSLAIFRAWGLEPLPAPADFHPNVASLSYEDLLPQVGALYASETVLYENIGWLWFRLKNWLRPPLAPPGPAAPAASAK